MIPPVTVGHHQIDDAGPHSNHRQGNVPVFICRIERHLDAVPHPVISPRPGNQKGNRRHKPNCRIHHTEEKCIQEDKSEKSQPHGLGGPLFAGIVHGQRRADRIKYIGNQIILQGGIRPAGQAEKKCVNEYRLQIVKNEKTEMQQCESPEGPRQTIQAQQTFRPPIQALPTVFHPIPHLLSKI